jgi:predicted nucleic acid-binding Zn ribbon protein
VAKHGGPPRKSQPEGVGNLISSVLEDLGLDETSASVRLLKIWDRALGPKLAPHCRPQGMRRGVVSAEVRDSAWMQRLQLEKPRILAALKSELGDAAPTDLRLRVGKLG